MITNRGILGGAPYHGRGTSGLTRTAFDPVIRSVIGIVRESAGLVSGIAGLGVALFADTGGAAPPRPSAVPRAANIIASPAGRRSCRQQ